MGLDMYLTATIAATDIRKADTLYGYPVTERTLRLGYWRKHPDLHGFIVNSYTKEDNCEPVYLDRDRLLAIAEAIEDDKLPHTTGFFFGDSSYHEDNRHENAELFRKAAQLILDYNDDDTWVTVYYQASW